MHLLSGKLNGDFEPHKFGQLFLFHYTVVYTVQAVDIIFIIEPSSFKWNRNIMGLRNYEKSGLRKLESITTEYRNDFPCTEMYTLSN